MSPTFLCCVLFVAWASSLTAAQMSCRGKCGGDYNRGNDCQCDYNCMSYGECCKDYESQCTTRNSCRGRCGENFKRGRLCSCDPDCVQYKQCCPDFKQHCDQEDIEEAEELNGAAGASLPLCNNLNANQPKDESLIEETEGFNEGHEPDPFGPDDGFPNYEGGDAEAVQEASDDDEWTVTEDAATVTAPTDPPRRHMETTPSDRHLTRDAPDDSTDFSGDISSGSTSSPDTTDVEQLPDQRPEGSEVEAEATTAAPTQERHTQEASSDAPKVTATTPSSTSTESTGETATVATTPEDPNTPQASDAPSPSDATQGDATDDIQPTQPTSSLVTVTEEPTDPTPEEPTDLKPQVQADLKPEEPADPNPEEPADPKPDEPADAKPDEPTDPTPEQPTDPTPEEPADAKPDQPTDPKPEQPTDPSLEEPADVKPDEPTDPTPEEPADAKPDEPTDPKPEEPTDPTLQEPADPKPEEPTVAKPDEPTDPKLEEPTDAKPDEPTDPKPDEPTDPKPEEPTDAKPDEPTDPKPDEPTDPKPEEPTDDAPTMTQEPTKPQPAQPTGHSQTMTQEAPKPADPTQPAAAQPTSKPQLKPQPRPTTPAKPHNPDDTQEFQGDDSSETNLCNGRPVSGVTTLRNGTIVVFRGHYFWLLDSNRVPGPPRGITQVWGVPSPIDTVFTRCNCQGKTYIFKGPRYWRFENDILDPGYPKVIHTGFDGLRGHITAALSVPQYQRRRESVYFFKRGGQVQKYSYQFGTSPTCGKKPQIAVYVHNRVARQAVSALGPTINIRKTWKGFPTTITAAVSIPSRREPDGYRYYVFSRSKSYNVRVDGQRPVIAAPRPNAPPPTNQVFNCPKKV